MKCAALLVLLAYTWLTSGQRASAQTAALIPIALPATTGTPVLKAPLKVKGKLKKKVKRRLQPAPQQPTSYTTPQRVKSPYVKFQKALVPAGTAGVPAQKQIGNPGLVPIVGTPFSAPARATFKRIEQARQQLKSATALRPKSSLAKQLHSARFARQPLRGQRFARQHLVVSALTRVHRARGTDYVVKPLIQRQERKASAYHYSRDLVKQKFVPLPTSEGEREREE